MAAIFGQFPASFRFSGALLMISQGYKAYGLLRKSLTN